MFDFIACNAGDEVEDDKVEDDDLEKDDDNDVEDDDVEEEDRSQDRDPHFVRACAIEMHMGMLQEQFFCGKVQVKNPRPRGSQSRAARFVRAGIDMHMDMSQEQFFAEKYG